jgi:hypothetical protein
MMRENFLANERLAKRMCSHDGHVVVRVPPGSEHFYIAVTDNHGETDRVKLISGPYEAST